MEDCRPAKKARLDVLEAAEMPRGNADSVYLGFVFTPRRRNKKDRSGVAMARLPMENICGLMSADYDKQICTSGSWCQAQAQKEAHRIALD